MRTVYRVFPFHKNSAPAEPGGALYVPPQGAGRIDNPALYAVLYVSDTEQGAIAEAFGRFPEWTPAILAGSRALPGSVRAIGVYELGDDPPLCDLDHARRLVSLNLRPSDVVIRDYVHTRAWARAIYEQDIWAGVRWWSYYEPRWGSIGLWSMSAVRLREVRPLRLSDEAMIAAARAIVRRMSV